MLRKINCACDKLATFMASSPGKGRALSQRVFLAGVSHINHLRKQQYIQYLSRVLEECL